ncbi:MAG TPA: DUF2569 family protein [Thermoanaerobaculia bacterium]|nr:DUF2569 family protein [Thermoanaerobaculia bacterium]
MTEPDVLSSRFAPPKNLEGVGGWLALFLVGQVGTLLYKLLTISSVWEPFTDGTFAASEQYPILAPLLVIESGFHLLQIVLSLVGIVLIARRIRFARPFYLLYLVVMLTYALVDIVGGAWFASQVASVSAELGNEVRKSMEEPNLMNARLAAFSVVWLVYWIRSERVRQTFIATGADE